MCGEAAKLLTFRNIVKRFDGVTAINGLDLEVTEGTLVGLIGPNGAGKTTLFNLITGLMPYDEGSLRFCGQEIKNFLKTHELAKLGIARTFQTVRLLQDATVVENLLVGSYARTGTSLVETLLGLDRKERHYALERCVEMLQQVNLYEKRATMVNQLPYGQQRWVEIGRALICKPILLLLDEPSAGMTVEEAKQLQTFILSLRSAGMTIIVIEHNMPFVMGISDEVVVLNFGQKIAQGVPDNVRSDPKVIEAYLGSKFTGGA